MYKYMKSILSIGVAIALAQPAVAEDNSITSADLKASPELQASDTPSATGAASIKCLVDTPKWDRWGSPNCFSAGFARTTTAFFQIDNAPSNYTVYWSDSRCSSTSTSCALPIRTYQSITINATVLDNSNNTFVTLQSRANYEGMN